MRRIDHFLLLNYPWLWTTRLHRLLYLLLPVWVLTVYVGLAAPLTQGYRLQTYFIGGLWAFSLLTIALLVYWFYGQDSHHLEKQHGQQFDRNGWREFASYAIAITATMTLIPLFIFFFQQRVSLHIAPQALVHDMLLLSANGAIAREADTQEQLEGDLMAFGQRLVDQQALGYLLNRYDTTLRYGASIKSDGWQKFARPLYDRAMLTQVGTTITEGEYTPLSEVISQYTRHNVATIESARLTGPHYSSEYRGISREAANTADFIYEQGFAADRFDALTTTIWTLLAVAIHLSLFRFLFKYAGRKGMWRTLGALFGLVIIAWVTMGASYIIRAAFGGYDDYYAFIWFVFTGWACFTAFRTLKIGRMTQFSWRRSVPAYLLPFLLIGLAYTIPALIGYITDTSNPYGDWFLYTLQFAYIPFIPYLKRQYTRLLTIPRST